MELAPLALTSSRAGVSPRPYWYGGMGVARTRHDEPDDDPDEWDESDEYDAERDYDPDDPETYPAGLYDDHGPPTVPCPHCGKEVFEDSEQCPRCGNYLSKEDGPAAGRGGTWVVLMILAVLAAIVLAAGR